MTAPNTPQNVGAESPRTDAAVALDQVVQSQADYERYLKRLLKRIANNADELAEQANGLARVVGVPPRMEVAELVDALEDFAINLDRLRHAMPADQIPLPLESEET